MPYEDTKMKRIREEKSGVEQEDEEMYCASSGDGVGRNGRKEKEKKRRRIGEEKQGDGIKKEDRGEGTRRLGEGKGEEKNSKNSFVILLAPIFCC